MKFSAQFEASQFPEWKKKYLRYVAIKKHIEELFPAQHAHKRSAAAAAADADGEIDADTEAGSGQSRYSSTSPAVSSSLFSSSLYGWYGSTAAASRSSSSSLLSLSDRGDTIMTKLLSELQKVDAFYRAMESELDSGFRSLQAQVSIIMAERNRTQPRSRRENGAPAAAAAQTAEADRPRSDGSVGDVQSLTPDLVATSPGSSPGAACAEPPPPSAMHHSYSTGAIPPHSRAQVVPRLGSSGSITHAASSAAAPKEPAAVTSASLRPSHAPSSYSYTSKPHHLHLSHSQQQQQHAPSSSAAVSAGFSESHPSFTAHLLHPLHPDLAHHRSDTELDLGSALAPLKSSFLHLLRRMTMLIHYVDINRYALQRLLSLFTSRSGLDITAAKFQRALDSKYVSTSRRLEEELIPATYRLFADCYERGDVERARVLLLARLSEAEYDRVDTFFLGLKVGVIAMLLLWNAMLMLRPADSLQNVQSVAQYAPVYRCTGLLVLYLWLWGAAVLLFDSFRISYVFVLQLNPRTRLTHFSLFNEAANLSVVYLVNCLLLISHYEQELDAHVSSHIYPVSLLAFFLLKLLTPSDWMSYWQSRSTLLASLAAVVVAPFGSTSFRDAYVGDVLTSMVKVLVDVEYSCLLVLSLLLPSHAAALSSVAASLLPFVCCAPLWFRFMQCLRKYYDTRQRWPHLLNALKYAVAHSVVIVSVFHPAFSDHRLNTWETFRYCWLASTVASSLYTFVWDVTQDWGLFSTPPAPASAAASASSSASLSPSARPSFLGFRPLRSQLLFGSPLLYCWAVFSNFFLRFCWVLTLVPFALFQDLNAAAATDSASPPQLTFLSYLFASPSILLTALTAAELFRRFQWTLLRVEWEQLVRGSGFRMAYYAPMMFRQQDASAAASGDGSSRRKQQQGSAGVVLEVVMMVIIVLIVAVLGAVL